MYPAIACIGMHLDLKVSTACCGRRGTGSLTRHSTIPSSRLTITASSTCGITQEWGMEVQHQNNRIKRRTSSPRMGNGISEIWVSGNAKEIGPTWLYSGVSKMDELQPMMLVPGASRYSRCCWGRIGTHGWRQSNGEMYAKKHYPGKRRARATRHDFFSLSLCTSLPASLPPPLSPSSSLLSPSSPPSSPLSLSLFLPPFHPPPSLLTCIVYVSMG